MEKKLTDFATNVEKIMSLYQTMNSSFEKGNKQEHLRVAISMGLLEVYNECANANKIPPSEKTTK